MKHTQGPSDIKKLVVESEQSFKQKTNKVWYWYKDEKYSLIAIENHQYQNEYSNWLHLNFP